MAVGTQISRYDSDKVRIKDVFVEGNYAYCASSYFGIVIFNIADPYNPVLTSSLDNAPSLYNVYGLEKSGNYLFCVLRTSGGTEYPEIDDGIFSVVDVSDIENPVEVESITIDSKLSDISISGNYAYVSSQKDGVNVIDITDPLNVSVAATYNTGNWETQGIHKVGNYAYCANYLYGLCILDVSNLGAITEARLDFTESSQRLWDVYCEGNYLYGSIGGTSTSIPVGGSTDLRGLVIYDVTDGTAPVEVSQLLFKDYDACSEYVGADAPPLKIAKSGNFIFLANGHKDSLGMVTIVDVADVENPVFIGSIFTDGDDNLDAIGCTYPYIFTGDGSYTGGTEFDFMVLRIGTIIRNATLKNCVIK